MGYNLRMSYTRMHLFATALTLAAFAAFAAAARVSGLPLESAVHHGMWYIGFVHFAAGYVFFFSAPAIQAQMAEAPAVFWSKVALCGAVAVMLLRQPVYVAFPLVQTLFYLHAAENSAYKIARLSPGAPRSPLDPARGGRPEPAEGRPEARLEALFPLALVLIGLRVLPGFALHTTLGLVQLGVVIVCMAIVRALLPVHTDWRAGAKLIGRSAVIVGSFALVAMAFRERGIAFDLFIVWHCIIWFLFTWQTRPAARGQLVRTHLGLGGVFAVLFALHYGPWAWGALPLAVDSEGFLWQSALHILLSFVFRRYGAATLPRLQTALAIL